MLFVMDWLLVVRAVGLGITGSESDRWMGVPVERIEVQAGVLELPSSTCLVLYPQIPTGILPFLHVLAKFCCRLEVSAAIYAYLHTLCDGQLGVEIQPVAVDSLMIRAFAAFVNVS